MISEEAFNRLEQDVNQRNQAAYQAAESAFAREGYTPISTAKFHFLVTDMTGHRRCMQFARGEKIDAGPKSETIDRVNLFWLAATKENAIGDADPEAACGFFMGKRDALEITGPGGLNPIRVHRWPHGARYARRQDGQFLFYILYPAPTTTRSAKVKRSCDHMPQPPRRPFDNDIEQVRVAVFTGDAPTLPMVTRAYPAEELVMECTHNLY